MGTGQALLWAYVVIFSGYSLVVVAGASLPPRRAVGVKAPEPPLSVGIVVPAYNEMTHTACIAATIATARALQAPVVVVDDGSTDGSAAMLERLCGDGGARLLRHGNNRGKAAALNSGIAALDTDLVVTLDADTVFEKPGVLEAVARFADPQTAAVAVTIQGAGGSHVARAQMVEYRYVLNFERAALARFGVVFTIPGAASVWRRRAVAEMGGFQSRTCAEDTDATISLSLAGWHVEVATEVRAVTECPLSLLSLMRQRSRWIWGTIQAASFALLELLTKRPPRNAMLALLFVAVTALNVFGFLLAASVVWRLVRGELGWSDVLAAAVLVATTVVRLALVQRMQGRADGSVVKALVQLGGMQVVNTAAFWYGLMMGRAGKMSW